MALGERVRFYRVARRMSQAELAKRVFMAPAQLNRYEKQRSRPTIETATRLARALGVKLSDLLVD